MSDEELLNMRIRQFLVHSFLYYKLDTPVISDSMYDSICKELSQLKTEHDYSSHPYASYITELDASGSGFYITDYPPNIISTAFHLLYNRSNKNESFPQFVSKWGYST